MCVYEENVTHKARLFVPMFYKYSNEPMLLELTSTTIFCMSVDKTFKFP